jgi:uncharacterized membrane protein
VEEGWMLTIMLSIIVVSCIVGALYLHEKQSSESKGFVSEILFWLAVLVTLLTFLATWLSIED